MNTVQNLRAVKLQTIGLNDANVGQKGYAYLLNENISDSVSFGSKKKDGGILKTLKTLLIAAGGTVAGVAFFKKGGIAKVKGVVKKLILKLKSNSIKINLNKPLGKDDKAFFDGLAEKIKGDGIPKVNISKFFKNKNFKKTLDNLNKSSASIKSNERIAKNNAIRNARISEYQKFAKEHRIGKNNIKSAQESAKAMQEAWAKAGKS